MKAPLTLPAIPQSFGRVPIVDRRKIADTIQGALTTAGLGPAHGVSGHVNETITHALSSAGLMMPAGKARESSSGVNTPLVGPVLEKTMAQAQASSRFVAREQPGQFVCRSYSNSAGTLTYKLYIPKSYTDEPIPLIVMLHGCTQNPDDFAAGTRMNALADEHGFFVVYPAQSARANGANCWNWFSPAHQAAGCGEPSMIAGITREVTSIYSVDEQRIFVAGLSAGAAMAVILGATYPQLFAAVGAHSGLAYGAAHDVPSAFAAMRGSVEPFSGSDSANGRTAKPHSAPKRAAPTIVFHGDQDTTVSAINGAAIVAQAIAQGPVRDDGLIKTVRKHVSANGREYTATSYGHSMSPPHIEQWVVHGAGHAWSGGSADGSYTDVSGPDASVEMLRFFLAQREMQLRNAKHYGC